MASERELVLMYVVLFRPWLDPSIVGLGFGGDEPTSANQEIGQMSVKLQLGYH